METKTLEANDIGKSLGYGGVISGVVVANAETKTGWVTAVSMMINCETLLLEFARDHGKPVSSILPTITIDEYLDKGPRTLETVRKYGIKLTDKEMAYLIACSL
jgi:hypothetical protein